MKSAEEWADELISNQVHIIRRVQQDAKMYGWECPRCHKIHSPFVQECYCPPPTYTYSTFNTEEQRYEWEEAIECIKENINLNPYDLRIETIDEFKKGLETIQKARIYLERIDYLLSGDDGEDSFHERLKGDLKKMKNEKD